MSQPVVKFNHFELELKLPREKLSTFCRDSISKDPSITPRVLRDLVMSQFNVTEMEAKTQLLRISYRE